VDAVILIASFAVILAWLYYRFCTAVIMSRP